MSQYPLKSIAEILSTLIKIKKSPNFKTENGTYSKIFFDDVSVLFDTSMNSIFFNTSMNPDRNEQIYSCSIDIGTMMVLEIYIGLDKENKFFNISNSSDGIMIDIPGKFNVDSYDNQIRALFNYNQDIYIYDQLSDEERFFLEINHGVLSYVDSWLKPIMNESDTFLDIRECCVKTCRIRMFHQQQYALPVIEEYLKKYYKELMDLK